MLKLKLKLQSFGHWMGRADSLEKILMLGKIEGKRRRWQQRMRWLDDITDSMDKSLSKLWEIVKDREAWHPWGHKESNRTSVQFNHSVVSDSLQTHGLQHARPRCPSPTPGVHPNSCPLSQWCHPTISSSVLPFSSRLQSFPASGSFQMSQFFASGGQNIEFQLQHHQSFQWIFRTDFL